MNSSLIRFPFYVCRYILLISGIIVLGGLYSCNPTKKLHQGEYLLNTNKIIYRFNEPQKTKGLNNITNFGKEGIEQLVIPQKIAPSEVLAYVKQKPNTRILFILPFYLYLYNLPDSAKTASRKAIKDSAYRIKAERKGWKAEKLKRKIDRKTGREWIMSQGEPPVILDSVLTQKSTEQIRTFLFNKGYYDARVKDSIHIRGKKAEVSYILKPGKPYRINNIQYFFEDPGLASVILSDTSECLIRRGDIYDKDVLDAESDRITAELNNAGFYYFTKQYVSYTLDTNSKTHLVDLAINIKRFVKRDPRYPDSVLETTHAYYRIRNVVVQMNYNPTLPYHAGDSIMFDGLKIVYPKGDLAMNPSKFRLKIFVTPGDAYRVINREDTYTGLSQLNEFSYISVKYVPVKDSNYLDSYIQLMPVIKHSIGAEFEATNTGGDLGVQGDVSYLNHNQFKGAEQLTFKLNGGLIAQRLLASSSNNNNINKYIPLNTIDIGPELDLSIPRPLFPFSVFRFKRRVNPQSTIKLSFDYQQRPDYSREVLGLSYAFDYNPVKTQHLTFALLELSVVNATLSPAFAELLQKYNLFFQNSFRNQFITDSRFSWLITNQDPSKRQKHFSYWKFNFENSGLDLYALEHAGVIKQQVDQTGSYYILGLPSFSQYTKVDAEYRQYFIRAHNQKIVLRFLGGCGLPYDNSSELPFTKSFWAGGSNDIRAWQIQTLGPGGSQSSAVIGQIGEIKFEGNIEYRVSLIKYFGIAFFADAGNIWLIPNSANKQIPLATFQTTGPNPFYSEIAVGTGIGFRFDFNYFVFRLDLGNPFKDPSLPAGKRWLSAKQSLNRTILNIGIGYPF